MITSDTDYKEFMKRRELPNGEKVELHTLEPSGYRVTVFSEDDMDWDWEDRATIKEAEDLFDRVESLDQMMTSLL